MGGKSKQAHRTKNNARPSSSGRSAELLGSNASGESAYRAAAALFPTLAAAAASDVALQPDLALALKKLNKKDPITKCKALQELSELVCSHKAEDVELLLPHWTHLYGSLSLDPHRKVRELTQTCHGQIVGACGRRVAPYLKALLPAWLQAQYDEFGPAQVRAHASLHSTFPESKLPEAISFCRVEILQHLLDNLLDTNAAVSKKLEDAEERLAAWSRVACSALAGLRYFVGGEGGGGGGGLPPAHDAWLWERLQPLLKAAAFWKLAAHTKPELRGAWYGAAGALAARFGAQWAGAFGARTLRVLLNAKESGAAAGALWQALLAVMTHDPEWYERIDKKELIMKRLVETLEAGGWDDARALSELLPRLLACLPAAALAPPAADALFAACFAGLRRRNVLMAAGERQAWLAAVAALVRHVAATAHIGSEAAAGAVRQWVHTALATDSAPLLRESADCLAALAHHWTTHQQGAELLVRGLWQSVASTAGAQLAELAAGADWGRLDRLLAAHSLLLLTLRAAFRQEQPKKRRGVRFDDEPPGDAIKVTVQESSQTPHEPPQTPQESPQTPQESPQTPQESPQTPQESPQTPQEPAADASSRLHQHHLEDAAQRVVASYLEFAHTAPQHVPTVLKGLLPLLTALDSKDIWAGVGRALGGTGPAAVWDRAFRPWLGSPEACCESLVDAVLLLVPHLEPEARADVFTTIARVDGPAAEWVVCKCAVGVAPAPPPAVRAWLRGAGARAAVLRVLARALQGDANAQRVLLACVDSTREHGPAVGEETVRDVLASASDALAALVSPTPAPAPAPYPLPPPATPAVCAALPTAALQCPHVDQLLLTLFRYDLHSHMGQSEEGCGAEVRAAWRGGGGSLPAPRAHELVSRGLACIQSYLQTHLLSNDLESERMKHVATLCAYLSEWQRDAVARIASDLTAPAPAPATVDARGHVMTYALQYDCIAATLCCPIADTEPLKSITSPSTACPPEPDTNLVVQFGRECILRGAYLQACAADDRIERLVDTFAQLLHDCALVKEMEQGYAFWSGYKIVAEIQTEVAAIVKDIIAACSESVRLNTLGVVRDRAASRGYYWALALARYRGNLLQGGAEGEESGGGGGCGDLTGDGFFHTLQAEVMNGQCEFKARAAVMLRCLVAAHGDDDPVLAAAAASVATRSTPAAAADVVIDAYYRRNQTMLYDTDVSVSAWCEAVCTASVCDFLTSLVERTGWEAAAHVWDFATITLSSVLAALHRSKHAWGSTKVSLLSVSAVRLYGAVSRFVTSVRGEAERRQPSEHVVALPREWADVFEPEVARCVYNVVMHVLESTESAEAAPMSVGEARALQAWCEAVRRAPYGALPPGCRQAVSLERLASAAAGALASAAPHAYKYLAFYTFSAITDPLVLDDAEKLVVWSGRAESDTSERPPMALDHVAPALARAAADLAAALQSAAPDADGEGCDLQPHTPTHSLALGYLLLAAGVGGMTCRQQGDLAAQYPELVQAHALVERLLPIALLLLPPALAAYADEPATSAPPPKHYDHYFLADKEFTVDEPPSSEDVSRVACRALYAVIAGAGGGAARAWRGAAAAHTARALSRLVAAYVTPTIVRDQLRQVSARASELEECEVCVLWAASEVTCAVLVDERRVEITIALATDHPLSLPRISAPAAGAGSAAGGTAWLAVYLAYQRGSLLSGLKLWAGGVCARVEAAKHCYICYCRLHPNSGRLPTTICHQCRNKYHPECLRKWFSSSNKSNCPLCRTSF